MADFLEEKRKEIQARLKELQPLVDEYHRLEAAERALSGVDGGDHRRAAPRPARRRSRRLGHRPPRPPARVRHAAAQALQLVASAPGITIPELAEAMGIKQNYLYRVMPDAGRGGQGRQVRPRLARPRQGRGLAHDQPEAPSTASRSPDQLGDRLVDPLL